VRAQDARDGAGTQGMNLGVSKLNSDQRATEPLSNRSIKGRKKDDTRYQATVEGGRPLSQRTL
jgi:hypothetical protein